MNSFLQSRHCSGRSWKSIMSSDAKPKADEASTYFTPSATSRSSWVGCASMTRASVAVAFTLLVVFSFGGCREEPTIVIKFEPNDLAGATVVNKAAATDMATAPKPADLAVAAATKPEKKKGAAAE